MKDSRSNDAQASEKIAADFTSVRSLDDALSMLDDAIATGKTDLSDLVTEEYQNLKGAIADMAPQVGHAIGDMGQEAVDRVSDFASTMKSKGKEWAEMGVENGKVAAQEIDSKVRENPWLVVGGVALGAFALGFFLGGRDNDREVDADPKPHPPRRPRGPHPKD